jgi:hypothetical protein
MFGVKTGQDRLGDRLRLKTRLDPRLFGTVQARGNHWMVANCMIDPPNWTHYYLFALERYQSFRQAAEVRSSARRPGQSPRWYDDGVRFLLKTQAENGSWSGDVRLPIDTVFSELFLVRSTKKSIEKVRSS